MQLTALAMVGFEMTAPACACQVTRVTAASGPAAGLTVSPTENAATAEGLGPGTDASASAAVPSLLTARSAPQVRFGVDSTPSTDCDFDNSSTPINGYRRDFTGVPLQRRASALNSFEAGPTAALPVDAGAFQRETVFPDFRPDFPDTDNT